MLAHFLPSLGRETIPLLAQAAAPEKLGAGVATGVSIVVVLLLLAIALVCYLFFCYCAKRICQKAGHEPGVLIWIPIANLVPLLTTAGLPVWMIILFFVPIVNFIVGILMWWKLCEARGKPGALSLLLLVPVAGLFVPLYLAFAD